MAKKIIITDKQLESLKKWIVSVEKNNSKELIKDVPQKKEGQVLLLEKEKKGGKS